MLKDFLWAYDIATCQGNGISNESGTNDNKNN